MPSKRFKKLPEKTNLLKPLKINELLPLVKKNCTTKFDESIDLSITINTVSYTHLTLPTIYSV